MNVFIFRRDLRWCDNSAFLKLINETDGPILPIFILNHKQLTSKYASPRAISFMLNAVLELKLHIFYDDDLAVLAAINKIEKINSVAFNLDYTPFARGRDTKIANWCEKNSVKLITCEDYSLLKLDREWRVFTPYYNHCIAEMSSPEIAKKLKPVVPENKVVATKYVARLVRSDHSKFKIADPKINKVLKFADQNQLRKTAVLILTNINLGHFEDYDTDRDKIYLNATTRLSAYIKFGIVSIREVYNTVLRTYGIDHGIIRELLWRDYYARVVWYNPDVILRSMPLKKYDLEWDNQHFTKWARGQTGVPIVDAAMRELKETGYMHNRCLMIVASFLVKDLHCDWRLGEQHFAKNLIDYDPCSNSGGWQGVSSVGADASQPYFRIMNPWRQAKRYDPQCLYIKKWIPELADLMPNIILNWDTKHNTKYIAPIVDHTIATAEYKKLYIEANNKTSEFAIPKSRTKK